jgi:hypothetical protein
VPIGYFTKILPFVGGHTEADHLIDFDFLLAGNVVDSWPHEVGPFFDVGIHSLVEVEALA